jgi:hypothetical protein
MTTARRITLSLLLVAVAEPLAFLLGLLSGEPGGDALRLYLWASFALAVIIVVVIPRLILGKPREGDDIEGLFICLATFVGALLLAAFVETFVLGMYVSFHKGSPDWETYELLGGRSDGVTWQTWLHDLLLGAPLGGGMVGAFLGFLGWLSRFLRIRGYARRQ